MPDGVITVLAHLESPGRVLLDSGEELRFGTGAVRDFTQRIGLRVHADELEPHPLGGQRARRLDPLEKVERKQAARARAVAEEIRLRDAAITRVKQLTEQRPVPACLEDWRALARDSLDASGLPRAVQKRALACEKVGACLVPGTGKTRLGGVPRLPAGVAWPMTGNRPHTALAELHVAELPNTLDLPMPRDASVVLLHDPDVEHTEDGAGAAIISRGPLSEPGPGRWPELSFRALEVLTLPAGDGPELALSGGDYVLYHNLVLLFGYKLPSEHQIGGHARDRQGAMGRGRGKGRWQLRAQFDASHGVGDMMWGDAGCIYFWVRTSELTQKTTCELRVFIQS